MLLCLMACSGSDNSDDGGKNSSQTVTMPAEASSLLVTLNERDEPIESATAQDNWMSVDVMPYTSGAPMVKLTAARNPATSELRTRAIIETLSKAKVNLTVIQKGLSSELSEGNSIEDTHDVVTDQPAYAPER